MKKKAYLVGAAFVVVGILFAFGSNAYAAATVTITPIFASTTTSATAGHVGQWSFRVYCKPSTATFRITGPGSAGAAFSVATDHMAGSTFVTPLEPIGTGFVTVVNPNQQETGTIFLRSGAQTAKVDLLLSEDTSTPKQCSVIGTATLITQ
jgi:hypothetical protein